MNLRKLNKEHLIGMVFGVLTPLLVSPLVLFILSWLQNYYFSFLWQRFAHNTPYRIKIITLSIIANLIWFYLFLNKENYDRARGIIIGTLIFAPYIIYIKFF